MTFEESIKHKNESVMSADESVLKLYHILIAPANTEESVNYINHFLKNPQSCNDETCKQFSSSDNYEIVSIRKEETAK